MHWFEDLTDARAQMQVWKYEYNEDLPHRSFKNLTLLSTRRSGTHRGQKIADPVDQRSGSPHKVPLSHSFWSTIWAPRERDLALASSIESGLSPC